MLVCLGVLNNTLYFFTRFCFVFEIRRLQKTSAFLAASLLPAQNKRNVLLNNGTNEAF